ncbi:MAG: hypothetical protein HFG29_01625 [Eubacterium sp.]|nr:hypothetical protein [Eubacterium sp.]
MRKKLLIAISFIVVAFIIVMCSLKGLVKEEMIVKEFKADIGTYDFKYKYQERFSGNIWKLFCNDKEVCSFEPFEGLAYEEMKEHLTRKELVKEIYCIEKIRVYALPLIQYERKYEIIYTLDGVNFYCWNNDMAYTDSDIKQRLSELYKHISEEVLKKVCNQSWE